MKIYKQIPVRRLIPDLRDLSPDEEIDLCVANHLLWATAKKIFDRLHPHDKGLRTAREQFQVDRGENVSSEVLNLGDPFATATDPRNRSRAATKSHAIRAVRRMESLTQ